MPDRDHQSGNEQAPFAGQTRRRINLAQPVCPARRGFLLGAPPGENRRPIGRRSRSTGYPPHTRSRLIVAPTRIDRPQEAQSSRAASTHPDTISPPRRQHETGPFSTHSSLDNERSFWNGVLGADLEMWPVPSPTSTSAITVRARLQRSLVILMAFLVYSTRYPPQISRKSLGRYPDEARPGLFRHPAWRTAKDRPGQPRLRNLQLPSRRGAVRR
jgi:hypothetical protein